MTALRAAAPISTSVQRKLTAAWSLLFWRPPGRGRSQLAAFVDDVDGTGGPPSRGADIGADHRHHERRYRDSTQQQRQSGVTVQQRCRTEASDEDGRHDRVPRLTTAQLLRTALRRSRYQRRPIRVTVTHHGSIIDRDYRRAHLRPTSERARPHTVPLRCEGYRVRRRTAKERLPGTATAPASVIGLAIGSRSHHRAIATETRRRRRARDLSFGASEPLLGHAPAPMPSLDA